MTSAPALDPTVLVEKDGAIAILTLNRPKVLNALNFEIITALSASLDDLEADPDIHCVILTGNERAFAAGADIKEMQPKSFVSAYAENFIMSWDRLASFRKPVIAAVAGYALGGGCEIAMMCDIIIAADNAKFGQPEISLGVMPGAGGTQRMTRIIGKAKAMDMCLTGRLMAAEEAERCGLVSRIVATDQLLNEARITARKIASFSLPITMIAKESINRAYETTLTEGLRFERRMFHAMFATEDQSEGMSAFIEKRKPEFSNR